MVDGLRCLRWACMWQLRSSYSDRIKRHRVDPVTIAMRAIV
jgi:hypothetical protein